MNSISSDSERTGVISTFDTGRLNGATALYNHGRRPPFRSIGPSPLARPWCMIPPAPNPPPPPRRDPGLLAWRPGLVWRSLGRHSRCLDLLSLGRPTFLGIGRWVGSPRLDPEPVRMARLLDRRLRLWKKRP